MWRLRLGAPTAGAAALLAANCTRATAAKGSPQLAEAPAMPETPKPPLRVLVTGFHDWRELEGNAWRCRDNPSCRLIYGEPCAQPPISRSGPLVRALARTEAGRAAQVSFQSMPVLWHTASGLDLLNFDLVVHLGLGVYDCHDRLLLECGAINQRRGLDAAGVSKVEEISAGAPLTLSCEKQRGKIEPLEGKRVAGGFAVEMVEAREENAFICNETHFRALRASKEPLGPRAVYFLHIPYARKEDEDHQVLAEGVAAVISRLMELEQ